MSEQENTIRALQIQCATNAKKIDQLRALNRKLRADAQKATHSASVYKEASKQNWETAERYRGEIEDAMRIANVWKEAFSKLAEAIGGKAK